MNSHLCPSEMCFFSLHPSIPFIQRHSLSRMRMSPTIRCVNVIQFREYVCSCGQESLLYTETTYLGKKGNPKKEKRKKERLYNRSVQDKSCLVFLILRRSWGTQLQCICTADEPVSRGRERQPEMNPGKNICIYKYLHMKMMFIQQDYQWLATGRRREKRAFEVILAKYTKI